MKYRSEGTQTVGAITQNLAPMVTSPTHTTLTSHTFVHLCDITIEYSIKYRIQVVPSYIKSLTGFVKICLPV